MLDYFQIILDVFMNHHPNEVFPCCWSLLKQILDEIIAAH